MCVPVLYRQYFDYETFNKEVQRICNMVTLNLKNYNKHTKMYNTSSY